jgi:hypothetical protein
MFGDSDIVRLAHVVEMFELLAAGCRATSSACRMPQLAILPGARHLGVVMQQAEWLTEMAVAFLDATAQMPPPGL